MHIHIVKDTENKCLNIYSDEFRFKYAKSKTIFFKMKGTGEFFISGNQYQVMEDNSIIFREYVQSFEENGEYGDEGWIDVARIQNATSHHIVVFHDNVTIIDEFIKAMNCHLHDILIENTPEALN